MNTRGRLVPLVLVLSVNSLMMGCTSILGSPSPYKFSNRMFSVADEDVFEAKVYNLDKDPSGIVNARRTLPPYIGGTVTLYGEPVPAMLRAEWTYKGERRFEELEAASQVPGGALYRGDVVVLIEGERARIGWEDCSKVAWEDLGNCPVGGVLVELPYAGVNVFNTTDEYMATKEYQDYLERLEESRR